MLFCVETRSLRGSSTGLACVFKVCLRVFGILCSVTDCCLVWSVVTVAKLSVTLMGFNTGFRIRVLSFFVF